MDSSEVSSGSSCSVASLTLGGTVSWTGALADSRDSEGVWLKNGLRGPSHVPAPGPAPAPAPASADPEVYETSAGWTFLMEPRGVVVPDPGATELISGLCAPSTGGPVVAWTAADGLASGIITAGAGLEEAAG